MKKQIIIMVLFAAASMLASSCGKMGSSRIFGELPSLNEEFEAKDQKFKEKGGNCKSQDEFLKLRKEYKEFEEKYKQLFAKQEEKLKGKEIPVELSEGIPFKVSKTFTIMSVTSSSKLGAYITQANWNLHKMWNAMLNIRISIGTWNLMLLEKTERI